MKRSLFISLAILIASCTSQKKLAYLGDLSNNEEKFEMVIPDYKIQIRDVLYITIKAMTPDGLISDFLTSARMSNGGSTGQSESGQYLFGYDVNPQGEILIPAIGSIKVEGLTLEETRNEIQEATDKVFNNAIVECKLVSYKFTVIGEVRNPGTYTNYNNYLTILEAIGRSGGLTDYGNRRMVTIIHQTNDGSITYKVDLQSKSILSDKSYFILPNDVIIVQTESKKIFNLNLPSISFILASVTSVISTTILLINYLGK